MITSLDNEKVRAVCKLNDKKYRKLSGCYLIEGERLVFDAFKYNANIVEVFVSESYNGKSVADAIVVSNKVFAKISDTVHSQGILAVVKIEKDKAFCLKKNCLILDGLQDAGNVGTLIRTAASCGFTDVFAINCVDVYSPKVLRAAMSSHFCVNIWQTENQQTYDLLKNDGFSVVVADMDGKNIFGTNFADKVALVVGNEGNGISKFWKDCADTIVALPMENNFESLNVSVAGSVAMYQIYAKVKKYLN